MATRSLLIVCSLCDSAGQTLSWDGIGRYEKRGVAAAKARLSDGITGGIKKPQKM